MDSSVIHPHAYLLVIRDPGIARCGLVERPLQTEIHSRSAGIEGFAGHGEQTGSCRCVCQGRTSSCASVVHHWRLPMYTFEPGGGPGGGAGPGTPPAHRAARMKEKQR